MKRLTRLPIIDIGEYMKNSSTRHIVTKQIRQVCKEIGFFYIKNHGVPIQLQKSIFQNAKAFFNLSEQEKNQIHMRKGTIGWKGYCPIGTQFSSGEIDIKEGFFVSPDVDKNHHRVINKCPFHRQNIFPSQLPQLKLDTLEWLKHMSILGDVLMQAIAESLHLDPFYFRNTMCKEHTGLLRILHYPTTQGYDEKLMGAAQHTDYGLLTILMMSDKGLEAQDRKDDWVYVDPVPDTFVINIGDVLQKITNGLYKSTPHKAKNMHRRQSRYSMPYFYDPGWDAEIKELDIEVDESERQLQRQTHLYKRWDNMHMKELQGAYNKYLKKRLAAVYPQVMSIL